MCEHYEETEKQDKTIDNEYLEEYFKEWGSTPGDIDDFIFYHELNQPSSK